MDGGETEPGRVVMIEKSIGAQAKLIPHEVPYEIVRIARRDTFHRLMEGFEEMRGVSYTASVSELVDLFEKLKFRHVELDVGNRLDDSDNAENLRRDGPRPIARLIDQMQQGRCKLYAPRDSKEDHDKFYLLSKPGVFRVICGSSNFTKTGKGGGGQRNTVVVWDYPNGHPKVKEWLKHFEECIALCEPALADLSDLIASKQADFTKEEAVEFWLDKRAEPAQDGDVLRVLKEIAVESVEPGEDKIYTFQLPESKVKQKKILGLLPAETVVSGSEAQVRVSLAAASIQRISRIPHMRVDTARRLVLANIGGEALCRTSPLPGPEVVNQDLEHLEAYVRCADWGMSPNPAFVKTSMYEAILYFFFSPFASEHLRGIRKATSTRIKRGPRHLFIVGPSQAGKSKLAEFATELVIGRRMDLIPGDMVSKGRLRELTKFGTVFPAVFNDVKIKNKEGALRDVLTQWWEGWFTDERDQPLIAVTTNDEGLKDWAQTRVKTIVFDVHFTRDGDKERRLAEIMSRRNDLFAYFSHLYLGMMDAASVLDYDELSIARRVMTNLYGYANRPLPPFFPVKPVEQMFDVGKEKWKTLEALGKMHIVNNGPTLTVNIATDIQPDQITEYERYLPPLVKSKRVGNSLTIETPKEFLEWFKPAGPAPAPPTPPGAVPSAAPSPPGLGERLRRFIGLERR